MDSGVQALKDYTWPGNVRQLQHLVERLVISPSASDGETVASALISMDSRERPVETLADAEEEQIRRVIAATGGNKASRAGVRHRAEDAVIGSWSDEAVGGGATRFGQTMRS